MSLVPPSSFAAAVVASLVSILLYVLYRAALPKPLANVPYNEDAAEKLFGDVPEMMGYVMRTKHPFESQDILLRRTKEFDRSGFFGDLINGILPEQHIQFLSTDERFKTNRNLINHLMAPTFVSQISAPEVYKAASTLIDLWQLKCDLAYGRPFSAHGDITAFALDGIFASSFGLAEEESNTYQRVQRIKRWSSDPSFFTADEKRHVDNPM
ncbi:hypothetical protein N0V93_000772 [Gnomoniopsis smithogilvyi]|uniref:Cytochrome P450 n=1 Tax=Gnomoniopsis smithogilvyi TaxID=1191159 RepID=A0A9W8Z4M2_9PEZI|nr:hypothetical protein N0V93_000772 [Gnomoniopsis smithogilvyi]